MKGLFVFNQINDIVFIHTDDSYKRHLTEKALEAHLIQKDAIDKPLDSNVVLQLFSPLIASQRFMIGQLDDPYTTIKGGQDYIMLFKQFSGYVFLAVNGDGEENEQFLHRKLCILHRIITFLQGPCIHEIRPDKQSERNEKWRLIGQMMTTWCHLYQTQQSFLVEATERLHVNDKVNKTCVELLEAALNGMKASGERQAVHAMLVAQTKLLALFSSRSATDLSGGDQLMFILLSNMLFKDSKLSSTASLHRLSSRETLKPTISSRGPVKIGKPLERGNSKTPLLENDSNSSSDSEVNSESEIAEFEIFSTEKESGTSSDSLPGHRSSSGQSAKVGEMPRKASSSASPYPLLSTESPSYSSVSCSVREPLANVDERESSLDQSGFSSSEGNKHKTTSLPPFTTVSQTNKETPVLTAGDLATATDQLFSSSQSTVTEEVASSNPGDESEKPGGGRGGGAGKLDGFVDYDRSTVMLRQGDVSNVPHSVHNILIFDGIYLVIVCELARVTHAKTITHSLESCRYLNDALEHYQHAAKYSASKQAYDTLDSHVKKLAEILKKSKGVPQLERIIVDIAQKWENVKQVELIKLLEGKNSGAQLSSQNMNRLEGGLSTVEDKLRDLFSLLYLSKLHTPPDLTQSIVNGIETIQGTIRRCLSDYKDYITIMAHRNMPMSIYVDEFPGMVHFIFINRSSNVMVAPSFHENLYQEDDNDHSRRTNKLIKDKAWRMFSWFQDSLTSGATSMMVREGDFYYSYFIWFEDTQGGFGVVPQVPVDRATSTFPASTKSSSPGTISAPYYSTLQRCCFPSQEKKTVCCYELMCVHLSLVPTQLALAHCRKLKDKLWKVSIDTNSPISLL